MKSKVKSENWIKIHRVLHTCNTIEQLERAYKWCKKYIAYLHGDISFSFRMMDVYFNDIETLQDEYKKIKGEMIGRETT